MITVMRAVVENFVKYVLIGIANIVCWNIHFVGLFCYSLIVFVVRFVCYSE